jgi:hypothetical protein
MTRVVLFCDYFHGDNGAGLVASHQTGWIGIVARGMHLVATTTAEQMLQLGKLAAVVGAQKSRSGEMAGAAAIVVFSNQTRSMLQTDQD